MNFYLNWFSPTVLWTANILLAVLLAVLLPPALRDADPHRHAAALLIPVLCWSLRVHIGDGHLGGMSYHLMGTALVTLMLGPAAALWLSSLLMLGATVVFNGMSSLPVVGLNVLCSVVPPVVVSSALLWLTRRMLPPQLFVYIFINGFIAAALGMMLAGVCIVAALDLSGAFPPKAMWQDALPVFLFMAWGEAFLTGLLCAIFIALLPRMLSTFSDERYLQAQKRIW